MSSHSHSHSHLALESPQEPEENFVDPLDPLHSNEDINSIIERIIVSLQSVQNNIDLLSYGERKTKLLDRAKRAFLTMQYVQDMTTEV